MGSKTDQFYIHSFGLELVSLGPHLGILNVRNCVMKRMRFPDDGPMQIKRKAKKGEIIFTDLAVVENEISIQMRVTKCYQCITI